MGSYFLARIKRQTLEYAVHLPEAAGGGFEGFASAAAPFLTEAIKLQGYNLSAAKDMSHCLDFIAYDNAERIWIRWTALSVVEGSKLRCLASVREETEFALLCSAGEGTSA